MNEDTENLGGHDLLRELRETNVVFRILFVLYALIGAYGGLYGGFLLLHETSHWIPCVIALVVVERHWRSVHAHLVGSQNVRG